MPSRDKNVKKKPSLSYKKGEEIKPQKRTSIFKGYPEVKRSDVNFRAHASEDSLNRAKSSKGSKIRQQMINERARELYDIKSTKKYNLGRDKDIPREIRAKGVKKLNRDMNRLAKVMDKDAAYSARSENKAASILEHSNAGRTPKSKQPNVFKRVRDLVKGGYIEPKVSRSKMLSPAGALIELGVQGYKPDKSSKKIKKLKKQAVST